MKVNEINEALQDQMNKSIQDRIAKKVQAEVQEDDDVLDAPKIERIILESIEEEWESLPEAYKQNPEFLGAFYDFTLQEKDPIYNKMYRMSFITPKFLDKRVSEIDHITDNKIIKGLEGILKRIKERTPEYESDNSIDSYDNLCGFIYGFIQYLNPKRPKLTETIVDWIKENYEPYKQGEFNEETGKGSWEFQKLILSSRELFERFEDLRKNRKFILEVFGESCLAPQNLDLVSTEILNNSFLIEYASKKIKLGEIRNKGICNKKGVISFEDILESADLPENKALFKEIEKSTGIDLSMPIFLAAIYTTRFKELNVRYNENDTTIKYVQGVLGNQDLEDRGEPG